MKNLNKNDYVKIKRVKKLLVASMLAVSVSVGLNSVALAKDLGTPTLDKLHNAGTIIPNSNPPKVYPESGYSLTKVDTKGANTITKYIYDATNQTLSPVYYKLDLKKTTYGEGDESKTFTVKAPTDDVTITAKYSTSNPQTRLKNTTDNSSTNLIGNYINKNITSTSEAEGGAIDNHRGAIGNIIGDFIGNYASATSSSASG